MKGLLFPLMSSDQPETVFYHQAMKISFLVSLLFTSVLSIYFYLTEEYHVNEYTLLLVNFLSAMAGTSFSFRLFVGEFKLFHNRSSISTQNNIQIIKEVFGNAIAALVGAAFITLAWPGDNQSNLATYVFWILFSSYVVAGLLGLTFAAWIINILRFKWKHIKKG